MHPFLSHNLDFTQDQQLFSNKEEILKKKPQLFQPAETEEKKSIVKSNPAGITRHMTEKVNGTLLIAYPSCPQCFTDRYESIVLTVQHLYLGNNCLSKHLQQVQKQLRITTLR